jgi:hypothetical protein
MRLLPSHREEDGVEYIVLGADERQPLLAGTRNPAVLQRRPVTVAVASYSGHLRARAMKGGDLDEGGPDF